MRLSCVFCLCRGASNCNVASNCLDETWPMVPGSDKVSCTEGVCVCLQCFTVNVSTGLCQVYAPCFSYNDDADTCIDQRQSQTKAFILSVLLSSVGAANFYTGYYSLGGAQLGLLVGMVLLCGSCLSCTCVLCRCGGHCCELCDEEVSQHLVCWGLSTLHQNKCTLAEHTHCVHSTHNSTT